MTPSQAADAAEAVLVDYEPLSAMVDVSARRCEGSPPRGRRLWCQGLSLPGAGGHGRGDMPLYPEKVWRAIREAPLK